jgi:hypothetical protein
MYRTLKNNQKCEVVSILRADLSTFPADSAQQGIPNLLLRHLHFYFKICCGPFVSNEFLKLASLIPLLDSIAASTRYNQRLEMIMADKSVMANYRGFVAYME